MDQYKRNRFFIVTEEDCFRNDILFITAIFWRKKIFFLVAPFSMYIQNFIKGHR